jgi:hypothetical protein
MTTDIRWTNFTTIVTNDNDTSTNQPNDDGDLKRILTYTIPLSCFVIVVVLLVAIGICKRHYVMEKWTSLTQMRNTNPKFYLTNGLRRDSEFDSYGQEDVQPSTNGQEYSLSTVF